MQSWRRTTEVFRQSWQQNKQVEGSHRYTHAGKQEKVSNQQCPEMHIPACGINSIFFSVFKTESDVFLKETTEHGFLQQQRTELSDPTHPSLCAQSCFKQLVIVKEHNRARQPSYSVVLFQFKFKPQYQTEETPKLWYVCLSCLEFNHPPEQPSTILTSSTPRSPGYSFALALLSLIQRFVLSSLQTFLSAWFTCGRQFCTVLEKEFKILLWRWVLHIG